MPTWIRTLAARAPTLLTLAALAALAVWGHATGWRLWPAGQRGAGEKSDESPIKVVRGPSGSEGGPARIEFPDDDAVQKVGIRTQAVQKRDVEQVVTAPGMLDYEHGRYARLTARASGSVWRVYREIG